MADSSYFYLPERETCDRAGLRAHQRKALTELLGRLHDNNRFYRHKWLEAGFTGAPSADDFGRLPLTSKAELVADAENHRPYGTNLTYPLERYVRLHQTSGTSGRPLVVLDTEQSWTSWKQGWGTILTAAGVRPGDCVFVAFSFGPFVGFWSGFEAAQLLGCRVLTGGGQTSAQRLDAIFRHQATVLLCTPSYALYLAEVARERGIDPASGPVRITIHAGEPGAGIPSVRKRIEQEWGARCFDHVGASEVGPYGFECHTRPGGVHVNEWDYIVEVLAPGTDEPAAEGEGELVLTNLNRPGYPVVRYRTGDRVRVGADRVCECGRSFRLLEGGIIGRVDDMMTIRGVNVFPSSIESIVREIDDIVEFEGIVSRRRAMQQLQLSVEPTEAARPAGPEIRARLQDALHRRLGIRIEVTLAEPGSLPRYELKARRFRCDDDKA